MYDDIVTENVDDREEEYAPNIKSRHFYTFFSKTFYLLSYFTLRSTAAILAIP